MEKKFTATASLRIDAPRKTVWETLTTPEIIKQYFYGTETITDWKAGSPIMFRGEWEGKTYEDKGTILTITPPALLRYTYWSSLSGTDEKDPDNYNTVTYALEENNGSTELTITQGNLKSEESRVHMEQNWNAMLKTIKEFVEKK
jgi:uncharacterized protein YndB with AHSA1/START domain